MIARAGNSNLSILESAIQALPSCRIRVFVAGCASGLRVIRLRVAEIGVTEDAEVVGEVAMMIECHAFEGKLDGLCQVGLRNADTR